MGTDSYLRTLTTALALVIAGCEPSYRCGSGLMYDPNTVRCVCLEGQVFDDGGACVSADAGSDASARDGGLAPDACDTTLYRDDDGDFFGDSAATISSCSAVAGYVSNADDCDDTCPSCHPGAAEVCDRRDNDCDGEIDGAGCARLPAHRWSRRVGGAFSDACGALTTTSSGALMVGGAFSSTASFGGEPHSSVDFDGFLASYGADGGFLWSRSSGGVPATMVSDNAGTVFVAGVVRDGQSVGGAPLTGTSGAFFYYAAAYDSDGSHRWSVPLPASDSEGSIRIARDPADGELVVAGTYSNGPTLGEVAGPRDAFVSRLSATGAVRWTRILIGVGAESIGALAIAHDSTVFVGGALSLDGGYHETPIETDGDDGVVLSIAPDGELLWSRVLTGAGTAVVQGLFPTAEGVAVAATFVGDVQVGASRFTSAMAEEGTSEDLLLALLDATGAVVTAHSHGGAGNEQASSLVVHGGDMIVYGRGAGPSALNGTPIPGTMFVARFSSSGELRWARSYGSPSPRIDEGPVGAVWIDPNVFAVCGNAVGVIDLGGGDLAPLDTGDGGSSDIVIGSYRVE